MRKILDKFAHPSKEKVRDWLLHRRLEHDPLPEMEQIQRDLWTESSELNGKDPETVHATRIQSGTR